MSEQPLIDEAQAKAAADGGSAMKEKAAHDSSARQGSPVASHGSVLIAGACYIATSSCLILFNKHALSSFNFHCPNSLLFFHCLLAVVLVKGCELAGLTPGPVEPLKWNVVKLWLPVNLIFVGMIATSFFSLKLLGVGMFSILKNISNLLAIGGDYFFFGKTYGMAVWLCMLLMMSSAIMGGMTDVRFTAEGYSWQMVNCVFTSGYALYLSHVMVRVQQHTSDGKRMGEFSMVYYNNLLSLGPIAILAWSWGELSRLPYEPALRDPEFLVVALIGGLLGALLSFSSLWYVSRSSATVYSLTGSMNKILIAAAGMIIFREVSSLSNLASIAVGLIASLVFVLAKGYVVAPAKV
mmetsp:Transcript_11149/g.19506  ORF Transcript_11149/g.19506 Transcript_11149/m.19506 type:complete len:352 (+) Transcript_11149:19-1074(+)